MKLIHTEQKKERSLHKLAKRWIQEKEEAEGMPDFFYCLKYKADIVTL